MTVDAQRHPTLPALSFRHARPLGGGLAAGLLLIVGACSVGSHSTSLGSGPSTPVASTYTIGGSITGVSGTGLVLSNGSTTVSVASGMSSFVFPTAVVTGTTYAVAVQASPAGLTCSVAGGSGTVQTANVNSIVVTCATSAYTIGGSVSGLTNTGLILQNGSDTVTIPSGATSYTLPTAVAANSSYNVTVQAEPSSGVYCSVVNGSGTVPAHTVTNANVTCSTTPFTVGGPVTGLNGTGLVLANGTDTVTVPANATSFSIPVSFGTTYNIGIQTPPSGLTCAVSNGTGTMPASNVTNVQVACSDQVYHLTGTVSGLTSGSLVLANGSTTVTVPANATGYSLPVPYTSQYTVMVPTQPTGLTCSVANPTGTMPASDRSGVDVTCSPNAYQVGGSITGLLGTGLVLKNGTDTTSPLSGATSYTMPNSVAYGATYDIQIQTQPRYYTCSITNNNGAGTITAAQNVTDVNLSCTANAEYAYSQDFNSENILIYTVDPTTHLLSAAPTTFFIAAGAGPVSVVVNPASTMVYAVSAGTGDITWYTIDPATGLLTAPSNNSTSSNGQDPVQLVFNAAGTLAWVVNKNSSTIQAYLVNNDGSLTASGSPYPSPFANPNSLTVNPTQSVLYATTYSPAAVVIFTYDGTGQLSLFDAWPAGNNPYQTVTNGSYAYVASQGDSTVQEYTVDAQGDLLPFGSVPTSGSNPQGLTFDSTGKYLYTANNASVAAGVSQFAVEAGGYLSALTPASAATYSGPASITVDPVSGTVYVVNSNDPAHALSAYSESAAGLLSPIGTSAGPAGSTQTVLTFATP